MKFTARVILSLVLLTLLIGSLGCDRKIGPPNDKEELTRPENVASFDRLYKQNCSACHGENGSGGPALDLANLKYQALVDDPSLRHWITAGMPGTQMPAFGESAGGFLTPLQVDVLVAGMRARWDRSRQCGRRTGHLPSKLLILSSARAAKDYRRQLFVARQRSEPAEHRHRWAS
jgi:cytochrome c oxidase cbb3-type subunit 3